jgi:hypothetical protein
MKKIISVLLVLTMVLLGGCAPRKANYTVRFYDGETIRLIAEVEMKSGAELTVPDELIPDGQGVKGLYMTSTLSAKYPEGTKVTKDMVVFIQWQDGTGEVPTDPEQPTEEPTATQGPTEGAFDPAIGDIPMILNEETGAWHAEVVLEAGAEAVATDRSTGETFKLGTAANTGSYIAVIYFEDGAANVLLEEIGYYVVGTCGNGGWEKDVTAANTKYRMTLEDGVYMIDVSFGDGDIGIDNKVTFKVARGAAGVVTNWYGDANGDNLSVDAGNHTITFDPASQEVLFG